MTDRTFALPEALMSLNDGIQFPDLMHHSESQAQLPPIAADVAKKNIDVLADVVANLPDSLFPIDAQKFPALKELSGIDKIEKHGSTYTVTTDHATRMPVGQPPVKSIDFDKQFSFHIGKNPETGTATLDNIQGVHANGSVFGHEVQVPVHSIEHTKQGEATFRVDTGLPKGMPGDIKADINIDNSGKVHVERTTAGLGGHELEIPPILTHV